MIPAEVIEHPDHQLHENGNLCLLHPLLCPGVWSPSSMLDAGLFPAEPRWLLLEFPHKVPVLHHYMLLKPEDAHAQFCAEDEKQSIQYIFLGIKFITKLERIKYLNKNPQKHGSKGEQGREKGPGKTVQSLKFHSSGGLGQDSQGGSFSS